jgi:hypothetical protein
MDPSWGFSLTVSGIKMPLFVISSRGDGWMTTRSPRGRSRVADRIPFVTEADTCLVLPEVRWLVVAVAKAVSS